MPVASATVETITSLSPEDYVVVAGAAFLAYLLVPPVWSLVSFNLRGYKGNGTTYSSHCLLLLMLASTAMLTVLLLHFVVQVT